MPAFGNAALGARHDGARLDIRRRAARLHDRLLRRAAAVLPRRRHRHAGRQRHGERPGDVRRAAAVPERAASSSRKACRWRRSGASCRRCGRRPTRPASTIVTGDTKVVDRGKGDGLYINTAGIGVIEHARRDRAASVRPGDVVLLSGDIGRHGMAIMAVREGLEFETAIESDCAPLAAPVLALLDAGHRRPLPARPHARRPGERPRRDRHGVGLAPPARRSRHSRCARTCAAPARSSASTRLRRQRRPLRRVRGRRPTPSARSRSCAASTCRQARCASATWSRRTRRPVTLRSRIGATRVVDMLSGEQLPRIVAGSRNSL